MSAIPLLELEKEEQQRRAQGRAADARPSLSRGALLHSFDLLW
jgi:hypothetical protein